MMESKGILFQAALVVALAAVVLAAASAEDRLEPQFGHAYGAIVMAVSPDGRLLATGGEDGQILVWDLPGGRRLRGIKASAGKVLALAFRPDGSAVLSSCQDNKLRLWNLRSGTVDTLSEHCLASALVFRNPNQVLVGYVFGGMGLFDLNQRYLKADFHGVPETVDEDNLWAVTPDARMVITWTVDNRFLRLGRDEYDQERLQDFGVYYYNARLLCISPDGSLGLVAPRGDGPTQLFRIGDASVVCRFDQYNSGAAYVQAAAFLPDGASLLLGLSDGRLVRWDIARAAAKGENATGIAYFQGIAPSPDGRSAVLNGGKELVLWDLASGAASRKFGTAAPAPVSLSPGGDGKSLRVGLRGGEELVWDLSAMSLSQGTAGFVPENALCAVSPDGSGLLFAKNRGFQVMLADRQSGKVLQAFPRMYDSSESRDFGPVDALAWSRDGGKFFAAYGPNSDYKYLVRRWNASIGSQKVLCTTDSTVSALAISADGSQVALADTDGIIRLVDAATGKNLLQIKGAVEKPRALSFSAKGDELSAGGQDGTVWRWSLPSGNPLVSLAGNGASLTCLAYGPGDALLYAASEDGGVRQWDLASAKPRLDFLSTADGAQWLVHDTAGRWNGSPEAAAIVARIVDGMATNLDAKERRPDLLAKK